MLVATPAALAAPVVGRTSVRRVVIGHRNPETCSAWVVAGGEAVDVVYVVVAPLRHSSLTSRHLT